MIICIMGSTKGLLTIKRYNLGSASAGRTHGFELKDIIRATFFMPESALEGSDLKSRKVKGLSLRINQVLFKDRLGI
jgi:hypothetical protein